ncbi:MAG: phosphate signaling complex protein PhoU [Acholeplasmataceae bacterium]
MAPRTTLIQLIEDIKKDVVQMADLALANIKEGLEAFKSNDQALAKAVMAKDDEVDQFEEDIAKSALRIIWREQPVAGDLRLVTGILKLITDIERIGDHASDIAEMTRHLKNKRNKLVMPITSRMAEIIEKMVLTSVEALVNVDVERAQSVIDMDDAVDDLFDEAVKKITSELKYDKIEPNDAIYIMMVAKYIERVGDHAVNIAEWIIFIATGTHKDTILF